MRFTILEKIKAETPLAELFNAYLAGLHTIELFSTPRESMRLCRELFEAEARGEVPPVSITHQAQRYYELTVLSNALGSLHHNVQAAAELLNRFFAEYDGDLHRYAMANRVATLNEYGGGEDDDWHHTGTGNPDAGEGWEVTPKTDPASLTDYTLHQELAAYFPGNETHGEFIGSSDPADFAHFTACVRHQTDFGLRQMFSAVAGKAVTISHQDETGAFVPVPIIDQLEQEMNEDIANETLAGRFNAVLNAAAALALHFAVMSPDKLTGYQVLQLCLNNVLAADVGEWPPF